MVAMTGTSLVVKACAGWAREQRFRCYPGSQIPARADFHTLPRNGKKIPRRSGCGDCYVRRAICGELVLDGGHTGVPFSNPSRHMQVILTVETTGMLIE
jgi:hypothetical protein